MMFFCSAIVYRYEVRRMPYVDYSSKQVEPLLGKDDVLAEGGVHQATWRLQRKRYAIRVEFHQTGSLGTSHVLICYPSGVPSDRLSLYI